MQSRIDEASALLYTLWNTPGYGELRVIGREGILRPYWLNVPLRQDHLQPALEWAFRRNSEGYNVYFGVHVRDVRRGRNQDVSKLNCLIVDLDDLDTSWPLVQRLSAAGYPASIGVRTKRGMHLYWLLREPESSEGEARYAMQYVQQCVHSDRVHDPARVLRLPGAVCHKTDAGSYIGIAWMDRDRKYRSCDLLNAAKSLWPDVVVKQEVPVDSDAELNIPLSADVNILQRFHVPAERGTRSGICMAYISSALSLGWPRDKIKEEILKLPIGGHYLDRGISGESSFDYDYNKIHGQAVNELRTSTRVIVDRVSIVTSATEDNTGEVQKLKMRLVHLTSKISYDIGFIVYITVPDKYRPGDTRWKALLRAANLSEMSPDSLISVLPGRKFRVQFDDDAQTVRRFFPDVTLT